MKTRALLLVLPLLAVSCRNGASVQIQDICFPTDDCTFSATCDKVLLGNPVVDTSRGTGALGVFLQVANQTDNNSDPDTYRKNTNDAHVDEIVIEYRGLPFPEQISLTNQRVPANGSRVVGVVIPGFDGSFATSTWQALTLVRMRGYFDNGSRFETDEFPIAVDLCDGCVTACDAGQVPCGGNDGQEPKTCFDPSGGGST